MHQSLSGYQDIDEGNRRRDAARALTPRSSCQVKNVEFFERANQETESQGVTTIFTYSFVKKRPSLPRACMTYSPGSLNVARTAHKLSGGIGGGAQRRAEAEPPR